MYEPVIAEQRDCTYTQSIDADAETVFPLLCPVRETEWIPGWTARMIHSRSGVAEAGAIFATPHERGETLWVVTAYEPPRRIQFVRYQPDGVVVVIDIVVEESGEQRSCVHIRYAFTATTAECSGIVRALTLKSWNEKMVEWESLMNAFLAARPSR